LEPHPDLDGALFLKPEADFPWPWLRSGRGMVQDLSSQALLTFPWSREPKRILDACAAPGGKTTLLAQRWPHADLFALEANPRRLARLKQNLCDRGIQAHVIGAEAVEWLNQGGKPFDLILVDAPCSGSGTLRKHPELTWIGDRIDLRRLTERQNALLRAAQARLAPGGLLLYAVCSWFPEEGGRHRSTLAGAHPIPNLWPSRMLHPDDPCLFRPSPLDWTGEGFQAFALQRD